MPIPYAEFAIVPPKKLVDYLLDSNHPVGGPKAKWFKSISYSTEDPFRLAQDLLTMARTSNDIHVENSPYG